MIALLFAFFSLVTSQHCSNTDCGPQLGMPNRLCPDKQSVSGPGPCTFNYATGTCAWSILTCPTTCSSNTCKYGATCSVVNSLATCTCPSICSDLYNPVCGSDGVTYSNACRLAVARCNSQGGVTQVSTGACPSVTPCRVLCVFGSKCQNGTCVCDTPSDCPTNQDPVCGSDGVTYQNSCLMAAETCNSQGAVTQVSTGACPVAHCNMLCILGTHCKITNGVARCVCDAPSDCPTDNAPVCGTDGVTYRNSCLLYAQKCNTNGQVTEAYPFACRSPPTCPPGVVQPRCLVEPCSSSLYSSCAANSNVYCIDNYCGGCFADFYDRTTNRKVNCTLSGNNCPSGVTVVNCLVNPCLNKVCYDDPSATCVSNYCGGCNWQFLNSYGYPASCGSAPQEQGCSVNVWRVNTNSWTSYRKRDRYELIFSVNVQGNPTLLQALNDNGTANLDQFLRESVAALLNSATSWNYRYTTSEVIAKVQAAFQAYSNLPDNLAQFQAANNVANCPLS